MIASVVLLAALGTALQRYPRVVHPRVVPHNEVSRDRRSVPRANDNIEFVSLDEWLLKTEPNRHLVLSASLRPEWTGPGYDDGVEPLGSCESRVGEVHGWEGGSRVLLTRCREDFFGLVRLENRTFLLEPWGSGGNKHLLYEAGLARSRRDVAPAAQLYEASQRYYNLTGDTLDAENYEDSPELVSESMATGLGRNNELDRPEEGLGYFFDRNWQREKLPTRKTTVAGKFSPPKWLELAVVADYSVVEFHGSRVQRYILALLNIVSAIYKDPSLDSNMQLVVVRMILSTEKKDAMVHQGNARRSLENVNRWNRKLLAQSNRTHDVAVWLTRLDIGGPSGYAPVSGACDPSRSCALNRDEGLTSAFILAHEVAHILGLSHDGDKNSGNACAREAVRGSIMAPMVAANFHNFHWSSCSKKEFHRKAKHWSCLSNRPRDDDSPIAKGHEVFSMDEQCRMEFGEGYGRCRSLEPASLCAHLWCGRANSSQACKTKKGPPLEGTLCAKNKFCTNGACETVEPKRRFVPPSTAVRGSESTWGPWSSWSECSRTCGVAVQSRSRRCNSGSSRCQGEPREYRVCAVPPCQELVDLRARQCSRFFYEHVNDPKSSPFQDNGTWLPYEAFAGSPNCQLVCYRKESGEIFHTGLDVEDGTPCSYEATDVCIEGKCRAMGCDGALDSNMTKDACGLCGGNNSTCENVTANFQRKLRRETTRLAVVPSLAYNIKVTVTILLSDAVPHEGNVKVLLRDGDRRRHEMSEFDGDGRAPVQVLDGAAFRLERLEEKYVLGSRGPATSEIVVSLVATREVLHAGALISVSSQYSIARSELRSARGRYAWLLGPPGACSASCGGGLRRRQLLCRDEVTRELVSRRKCLVVAKPPGHRELERCNTASCEYTWIPGMWERCVARAPPICLGSQRRRLYCVRASFPERLVTRENELRVFRNTLSPANCLDLSQPITERQCTRQPECPHGKWLYSEWTPVLLADLRAGSADPAGALR
ncbi:A disintegrin and metalloproteinase with thrombospondin motifs 2-like [Copidosoma floridanum]|uniref:A disintegrin and metalloproteinase with thrombospondin motifs 2-like n=1 Tax=Copidosoma floridanum TaxID=29053 RepID=UPI0006C96483|nr:A disintegrin and metalloproteinase with thrombospondin motifs 2-like [Copidosoma floridanum]